VDGGAGCERGGQHPQLPFSHNMGHFEARTSSNAMPMKWWLRSASGGSARDEESRPSPAPVAAAPARVPSSIRPERPSGFSCTGPKHAKHTSAQHRPPRRRGIHCDTPSGLIAHLQNAKNIVCEAIDLPRTSSRSRAERSGPPPSTSRRQTAPAALPRASPRRIHEVEGKMHIKRISIVGFKSYANCTIELDPKHNIICASLLVAAPAPSTQDVCDLSRTGHLTHAPPSYPPFRPLQSAEMAPASPTSSTVSPKGVERP
jgi:hypothetical protein